MSSSSPSSSPSSPATVGNAIILRQLPAQLQVYARAMNAKQKTALVAAAVVTVLALVFFVRMMQAPEMKILVTGMNAAEAQRVASQLEVKKIVHEVTPDGTVKVAADQLDSARLELAASGGAQSGRLGFELFDKPNWAGSEFSEHVNYQRALEGELEHTIATISQVESARVHLVLARESLFEDREKPAKAAVVLRLSGRRLDASTVGAIQNLVASAVEGLRPGDVTVVNAGDQQVLSQQSDGKGDSMEAEVAHRVLATLEPAVGEGKVRASVSIERELATVDATEELYDGKNSVPLAMQRSEQRSGSVPAIGGVPGTSSNLPGKANPVSLGDKEQSAKTESGTYGVNRTVRHSSEPPGKVRRMTVAVLLDQAVEPKTGAVRQRSKEEMERLTQLARAAAGVDPARGDVLQVESMAFDAGTGEAPSRPTVTERAARFLTGWSGTLRYLGIVLLFLMVYAVALRPLQREALSGLRMARSRLEAPEVSMPVPATTLEGAGSGLENKVGLKRRVLDNIEQHPEAAGKLLSNWLKPGKGEA